ncbi:twin-arginine translocation signal domain-containing protein [uncultured Ferrovibrio sp.]|jgi:nitrous oxide reductase|uniref:twin-arginine translocation signal domain-containing protein n=1 Tax=uncultured Ferrovibrio sp. TaxID=1576913 RepID=UPI0026185682|nr:twin-arginine translocation signal domain-containing protein [uncultured Ferrovibrio sp.]
MDQKQDKIGRRDFLRAASLGAAAGAVATVAAPAKVEAAENAETRKKQRYRETEHVKRYYETNRL